jgi:hypothetical protein
MSEATQDTTLRPRMPIRRFDVFAEYERLKGLKQGMDEAHAEGYGVWVAKVVASGGGRRAGATKAPAAATRERGARQEEHEQPSEQEWHVLGGEPQTDETFQHDVIRRMGPEFYHKVFAPALAEQFAHGTRYEQLRDTVRKNWAPAH